MASTIHPALDPACFGEGPERDERFTVKEVWVDLVNLPDRAALPSTVQGICW